MPRPRGGGGVFRQLFFESKQSLNRPVVSQQMFVVAHGDDRLPFNGDHLEAALFKELSQARRRESRQLELLSLVSGQPVRPAGADEFLQRIEVSALDEMIQCRQLVI